MSKKVLNTIEGYPSLSMVVYGARSNKISKIDYCYRTNCYHLENGEGHIMGTITQLLDFLDIDSVEILEDWYE